MRASLSLHLSLFRRQKAQISRAVEGHSAAFRAYEARYRRRTRTYQKVISRADIRAQIERADVVYVGDYHTLRLAQESFLELVQAAAATPRALVLAIEFVEGRHQRVLDAYLAGEITERQFLDRIGHPYGGGFDIWPSFKRILDFARAKGLRVLAIDRRARGTRSLALRDAYAAARVARAARAPDRPQVLVLMGQFHVAPCHLPAQVKAELGPTARREHLVIYQNCEGVYWRLARRGLADRAEGVSLRDGELCLNNTSPVVCQQSFLDYLEAEAGDEPLANRGAAGHFREMARLIGRFAGIKVKEPLADVQVGTVADVDFLARVQRRGRFTRAELALIRRQILSRESYYIPRARTAYLATLSLNHAAEEAAHFVRHCSVGDALERPRRPSDAFYARCLEEALGFFGSKLVNPRRRCLEREEWVKAFQSQKGEPRQIAAFVLAHRAAELEDPDEAVKLIPLREGALFHGVSHALGYQLGEALYRAFDAGTLSKVELRVLFRDPFDDPRARYFALTQALQEGAPPEFR